MFFRRLLSNLVFVPCVFLIALLAAIERMFLGRFTQVFGRFGLVWALAFTVLASLLRWGTDRLLADASPFSFYYLSVVLTALVARIGSAIVAVILGGATAHFLWVEPRFTFQFLDNTQVAQLVIYVIVATLCGFAVSLARFYGALDYLNKASD